MARLHRRSIRLKGYDYSRAGAYFVTVCVQGRECLLGKVEAGEGSVEAGLKPAHTTDDNPIRAMDGEPTAVRARVADGFVDDTRGIRLTRYGEIVRGCWEGLPQHYPQVELDAFVVMPNHVHGIIVLPDTGAGLKPARTASAEFAGTPNAEPGAATGAGVIDGGAAKRYALPEIVRGFKTFSARGVNELRETAGVSLWQRGYYEHVVRDDRSLDQIRRYIEENPMRWVVDRENPGATGSDDFDLWLESLSRWGRV